MLDFKGNRYLISKNSWEPINWFRRIEFRELLGNQNNCYHETSRLYTPYMNFHCDALYIIPSLNISCKGQIEENYSPIISFSTFSKVYTLLSVAQLEWGEEEDLSYLKIIIFMNLWGLPSFLEKPAQPQWYFVLDSGWVSPAYQNSYLLFLVIYSLLIFSRDSNTVSLKIVFTMNFWYTLFFLEANGLMSN